MHHRASPATRPGLDETPAGGPVRITGGYPPPLAPAPAAAVDVDVPRAGRPRVTRYDRSRPGVARSDRSRPRVPRSDRSRHRAPRAARPTAARAWAGASAVLAVAGLAAVVLLPRDDLGPARLDVPVAVAAPSPATEPGPARLFIAGLGAPAPTLQLPASEPVRVQIPALGVTSRVMDLGLERDGTMEVPPGAYPVGWYDRSPTPGQLGPAVLAGHVDWDGEPGAFHGLSELRQGDEVVVDRADGTVATFQVDRIEEHAKDDFPSDEVYGDLDHAGLRLITCGGGFDEDTGDYQENVIVFASLVTTA